jgi:hypothetical protein
MVGSIMDLNLKRDILAGVVQGLYSKIFREKGFQIRGDRLLASAM